MFLAGDPLKEVPRIANFETGVAPISGSEPTRGSCAADGPTTTAHARSGFGFIATVLEDLLRVPP